MSPGRDGGRPIVWNHDVSPRQQRYEYEPNRCFMKPNWYYDFAKLLLLGIWRLILKISSQRGSGHWPGYFTTRHTFYPRIRGPSPRRERSITPRRYDRGPSPRSEFFRSMHNSFQLEIVKLTLILSMALTLHLGCTWTYILPSLGWSSWSYWLIALVCSVPVPLVDGIDIAVAP